MMMLFRGGGDEGVWSFNDTSALVGCSVRTEGTNSVLDGMIVSALRLLLLILLYCASDQGRLIADKMNSPPISSLYEGRREQLYYDLMFWGRF